MVTLVLGLSFRIVSNDGHMAQFSATRGGSHTFLIDPVCIPTLVDYEGAR